ncbi:MAG: BarH protein [Candidatus Rokuibacteriota bacterium]|nr:MAG: BarH protein [Candidatus Rokubacteria bacterium]
MAKAGFRVLDSDLHIIEPPDLWARYIDAPFKHRAPRGLADWVLDLRIEIDGKLMPADVAYSGTARGRSAQRDRERFRPFHDRGWDARAQLDAMDEEGIDVGVIYPTRGLFAQGIDGMEPKFAAAIARAYNNWLYDFCAADPARLIGAGMISPFDVDDAVAETRRCVKELGFRGIFLRPNPVNARNWHEPYYGPLWSELEALDVPLGFHEGLGAHLPQVGDRFGRNVMLRHTVCHPAEQMLAAVSFCGGGVLHRHPRLRVAFLEGNASWAPFLLWRMDEHYEWLGDVYARELTMEPSGYFKRQCFVSVECDEDPVTGVVELMGALNIVFSTDFPHPDCKYPGAVARFLQLPLSDDVKRAILWDNTARFYGLA